MRSAGLDIRPHRARMNDEDLDERFKDPDDPLRLVFVCAMWMTGFDAPSCSTIYLDRPMRNHTLMQTIARANRVFPDKENGLIVDYVGVFRNLEKALAIYGAANAEDRRRLTDPRQVARSSPRSSEAIDELRRASASAGTSTSTRLRGATGFEFIALRDAAVEALLVDDETRRALPRALGDACASCSRRSCPTRPRPHAATVAAIRVLAETDPLDLDRRAPDLDDVSDAVDALLDRSVGAEEYVIRAAAEGIDADPLIDLTQIDFDALAARFAGRKRSETERLAGAAHANARRRRGATQPDPLRPRRADRGADRRVQRRQPQHRRVAAPPHRALADALRRGAADRARGARPRRSWPSSTSSPSPTRRSPTTSATR